MGPKKKKKPLLHSFSYLPPLRVLNAREAQVADAPAGVDAVHLQLGQLKGRVEGLGADADHDGVDGQRHALHHLLRKAVFTTNATTRNPSEVNVFIYLLIYLFLGR